MALRKFIGGCKDGELIEVPEDQHHVVMSVQARATVLGVSVDSTPYGGREYQDLYYERLIRGGMTTFSVFVIDGISDDEMMEKLIMGYKSNGM